MYPFVLSNTKEAHVIIPRLHSFDLQLFPSKLTSVSPTNSSLIESSSAANVSTRLFVSASVIIALRKHAYSNTLKILPPKNGNFSDKQEYR